jgi:hypothetical protein
MNKKLLIISVAVLLFVVSAFYLNTAELNTTESNTAVLSTNEQNDYRENYKAVLDKIDNNFKPEGYEEILDGDGHVIAVPTKIAGIQNYDDALYSRMKPFVYKNKEKSTIILLTVTGNSIDTNKQEWICSMGYVPDTFNDPEDRDYGKYYSDNYPNVQVFNYSFYGNGYNISLISIREEDGTNTALDEVAVFAEELSDAIKIDN